ncbi:MAG: hypothetical protein RBT19_01645 [Tenuifilaceae bacterium]|jgi:hypothetical protein|nr:hypothetical protein [Tenuifilaceae bacterium]
MAKKSKHTINDIQKALMSNTRFIKEEGVPTDTVPIPGSTEVNPAESKVAIDPLIMKKIKILAPFMGETTDELINKALNHYLRLKSLQLDQAIQKITEE